MSKLETFYTEINLELAGHQWSVPVEVNVLISLADKANGVLSDESEICWIGPAGHQTDPAHQAAVDSLPKGTAVTDALLLAIHNGSLG